MVDTLRSMTLTDPYAEIPVVDRERLAVDEALRFKLLQQVLKRESSLIPAYVSRQLVDPADMGLGYLSVCGLAVFEDPTHPNNHFNQTFSASGPVSPVAVKAALQTFSKQTPAADIVTKDLRRRNALSPEMGKITISEGHLTRGGYPVIIGTLIQPFTESMTQGITQISELTYLRGTTITQALILLQLGIRAVIRNS